MPPASPVTLSEVKRELLHQALAETAEVGLGKRICGAANCAAALAWAAPQPAMAFPSLFETLIRRLDHAFGTAPMSAAGCARAAK